MSSQDITDILLVIQVIISLLISIRAFFHCLRTRSDVLFSIGLSMGIIALGGIYGLLADNFFVTCCYHLPSSRYFQQLANYLLIDGRLNTLWFRYIGQTVSYLFIYLTATRGSMRYIRSLKWWHLLASAFLFGLLWLPFLVPTSSDPVTLVILSGSRSIVCFAIFLNYTAAFNRKETRFSFLMSLAFLLITFGVWIYTMRFMLSQHLYLDYIGDSVRIVGLVTLLVALFVG
jgi:hypothetical protein